MRITWLWLCCAMAAVPAGALDGASVLATVDGQPAVTVNDVLYYYRSGEGAAVTKAVSAADVADVVENLVTSKILLWEAEEAGYGEAPPVIERTARYYRSNLMEALYRALDRERPVTEDEIRSFYDTGRHWRKYAVIRCKNREQAEAAHAELDAGRPWGEVFATYAIDKNVVAEGGVSGTPMIYDGLPASRAVFSTPAGAYTAATRNNDGIRWCVFRVDKIVHGDGKAYEQARPDLQLIVPGLYALLHFENEIAPQLRRTVPIARNEEMWRSLQNDPFLDFCDKWGNPRMAVGDVAGIPIEGDLLVDLVDSFFLMNPAELDAYRAADPADFAYVTDLILFKMENEALAVYEGHRRGLDQEPAFVRALENYRAILMTDLFALEVFQPTLPPPSDADVARYYADHPEKFRSVETVEVYLYALPDRAKLLAFYDRVKGGADVVTTGEEYTHDRARELMDQYDFPVTPAPGEEEFFGVVEITREPNAGESPDKPLAVELRPRVYPFAGLKQLSEVFQLRDGRWAFYAPIYYRPFKQLTLDDPGVKIECAKYAWEEYTVGEDAERRAREWLAALRARHEITTAAEDYEAAAAFMAQN